MPRLPFLTLLSLALVSIWACPQNLPGEGQACLDGQCDGSLLCVEDVCVTAESQETGTEGGACYGNGTCNAGLICVDDVCETDPDLGDEGSGCLSDGTCNAGLVCVDEICRSLEGRDAPCDMNNQCPSEALVCIASDEGPMCRLVCDLDDDGDPCGEKSTCRNIDPGDGVCVPAGRENEECPCDEGFVCLTIDDGGDAGMVTLCRPRCELPDTGADDPCGPDATCQPLSSPETGGACVVD